MTQLRAKGLSESSVRQIYTVARVIGDSAVRDILRAIFDAAVKDRKLDDE